LKGFTWNKIIFYRIGVRFNDEVAIYYSLKGFHTLEEEEWLEEQAGYGRRSKNI